MDSDPSWADADTYPNTDAYAYANSDTHPNSNADDCSVQSLALRRGENRWACHHHGQPQRRHERQRDRRLPDDRYRYVHLELCRSGETRLTLRAFGLYDYT